jgi:predicted methyltransferase
MNVHVLRAIFAGPRAEGRQLVRYLVLAAVTLMSWSMYSRAAPPALPDVAAAVADSSRPPEDVTRDQNRKPGETLLFAGVKPGDVVADYIANSGYFTRLFSDVVGVKGHVYAIELNEVIAFPNVAAGYAKLKVWAGTKPNVTVETVPASTPVKFPRKLDVFWISQNYHDLHDKFLGPVDLAAFNRQVYDAMKPGGLYVVLDHSAAVGAPPEVTETLHRIDPETVKREVEAAGFELVAESHLLANPDDPRTVGVFNKAIVGHTDQFILKFQKPAASHSTHGS